MKLVRVMSRLKVIIVILNICCIISLIALIGKNPMKEYPWQQKANVKPYPVYQIRENLLKILESPGTLMNLNLSQTSYKKVPSEQKDKNILSGIPDSKNTAIHYDRASGGFQSVGDKIETFVYSAIYDDVETPIVRVFVLIRELNQLAKSYKFTCVFSENVKTDGTLQYVPEPRWGYSYRSAMVLCSIPEGSRPEYVTLNPYNTPSDKNRFRVIYPLQRKYNLTRCFVALHSNFNNTMQLVQTLELSLMFGVDHFVIYNYSIHPKVLSVLEKYQESGVVEILPWPLPINKSNIHQNGQLMAIQECMYRNLHVSEYIFTGDSDEVFVPKPTKSSLEMINMNFRTQKSCSCLVLKNAFFPLNLTPFPGDFPYKTEAQKLNLTYLLYTSHTQVFRPYDRSKLIIKPTGVEIGGIHGIEKFRKGKKSCVCPTNQCLLHHYRPLTRTEMSSFRQTDTSLHKYAQELTSRVSGKFKAWGLL